ncbi:MAG TPA: hypothetical protein VNQ74_06340 [Burkholderiaceae bacterium]|nr:hypothetical protein [Burkholderiaceae bacterium]
MIATNGCCLIADGMGGHIGAAKAAHDEVPRYYGLIDVWVFPPSANAPMHSKRLWRPTWVAIVTWLRRPKMG